jgi:ubiquinol-cytochrome c reductase cytochrome b subunit
MTGGWFVRGLHHFMAQAMVVLLAFHMLQIVWDGAYKAPREFNYWIGLILAQIVLGLALTGYLLPWDQKGYWATKVATNLMGLAPVVGDQVQKTAVGGADYGHHTLTRFFAMHAGVLPALLVMFLAIHLALFRRHGITAHPSPKRQDQYFWPHQVLLDGFAFFVLLAFLVGWIFKTGGAELTAPADPSEQYSAARPEWYFLFLFQLLKKFESEFVGAIVVPGVILLYLALMPFIARIKGGHWLNVAVLLVLIGGAGYLTYEAVLHDRYAAYYDEEPPASMAGDEGARHRHAELHEASRNYLAAIEGAHRESERVVELLQRHGGAPIEGAISLLRSDSETMGPRLFTRHCSACHDYVDPEGKDSVRISTTKYQMPVLEQGPDGKPQIKKDENGEIVYQTEPNGAPNLFGVGGRQWLRGLLDHEKIALIETEPPKNPKEGDPESHRRVIVAAPYFGNTKHREGQMAEFVLGDLTDLAENAEKKLRLDAIVAAVSAEAALPAQRQADAADAELIARGKAAFEETFESYACGDCHRMGDLGTEGSAPDLTGWMSDQWLRGIISNPEHEAYYGYEEGANDRMPAFAANPDEPQRNILTDHEIDMVVRWLRHEDVFEEAAQAK